MLFISRQIRKIVKKKQFARAVRINTSHGSLNLVKKHAKLVSASNVLLNSLIKMMISKIAYHVTSLFHKKNLINF